MPEVIIKYKGNKALQALMDLARYFDLSIEKKAAPHTGRKSTKRTPPITFSPNPDVTSLAGIWEHKDISLEDLRKKAWDDRS